MLNCEIRRKSQGNGRKEAVLVICIFKSTFGGALSIIEGGPFALPYKKSLKGQIHDLE